MLKLTLKDLKLFWGDRRAVLLSFFLPIFLITLFSLAFGAQNREDAKPMRLPVADMDNSVESQNILLAIDSLKNIEVEPTTLDSAQYLVKKGKRTALLVFHSGFADSLGSGKMPSLELQFDKSNAMEVAMLQQALMASIMKIIGNKLAMQKEMDKIDAQFAALDSMARVAIKMQIAKSFSDTDESKPIMKMTELVAPAEANVGLIQAVAGTAVMMLLFSVAAVGGGLLEEKEFGTLKKLLYSPINPNQILYSKMLTAMIISVFQLAIMFLYTSFMFNLNLMQNLPALILMIFFTAFAVSGFGIFLAAVARTRAQVQSLSSVIILTMSALGGSMIPTFIMPAFMQKISVISVNYWSIQGFYDIYWRQLPVTDFVFLSRLLVLFLMGVALITISGYLFRKNILKVS
jgi:ABC-type multidrug transport system permease subunit